MLMITLNARAPRLRGEMSGTGSVPPNSFWADTHNSPPGTNLNLNTRVHIAQTVDVAKDIDPIARDVSRSV